MSCQPTNDGVPVFGCCQPKCYYDPAEVRSQVLSYTLRLEDAQAAPPYLTTEQVAGYLDYVRNEAISRGIPELESGFLNARREVFERRRTDAFGATSAPEISGDFVTQDDSCWIGSIATHKFHGHLFNAPWSWDFVWSAFLLRAVTGESILLTTHPRMIGYPPSHDLQDAEATSDAVFDGGVALVFPDSLASFTTHLEPYVIRTEATRKQGFVIFPP